MISYEMAWRLKEAGFPQDLVPGDKYYWALDHLTAQSNYHWETWRGLRGEEAWRATSAGKYIKAPHLHDLIAACGMAFDSLQRTYIGPKMLDGFLVWHRDRSLVQFPPRNTPEDAVAELLEWLLKQRKEIP